MIRQWQPSVVEPLSETEQNRMIKSIKRRFSAKMEEDRATEAKSIEREFWGEVNTVLKDVHVPEQVEYVFCIFFPLIN